MGVVIGNCKKCGKLMMRPHPTGFCVECRRKKSGIFPDTPDLPDPLKYE